VALPGPRRRPQHSDQAGPAVTLPPLEDPIRLAEDVSAVDTLSGGRFEIGASSGSSETDYTAFGRDIGRKRGTDHRGPCRPPQSRRTGRSSWSARTSSPSPPLPKSATYVTALPRWTPPSTPTRPRSRRNTPSCDLAEAHRAELAARDKALAAARTEHAGGLDRVRREARPGRRGRLGREWLKRGLQR
jgi:hypothetical protein